MNNVESHQVIIGTQKEHQIKRTPQKRGEEGLQQTIEGSTFEIICNSFTSRFVAFPDPFPMNLSTAV